MTILQVRKRNFRMTQIKHSGLLHIVHRQRKRDSLPLIANRKA